MGSRGESSEKEDRASRAFPKKSFVSFCAKHAGREKPERAWHVERGSAFCGTCIGPIGAFRSSSGAVPTPAGDRVPSRTFMMVAPSFEMVVTPLSSCTSLSKPRGPCAIGRAWSAEIRNHEGGLLETTGGSANGEPTRGRTRVVRTESTTAMHALMLEISWPLPWLVSVPSRRSTIWGCCGKRGRGVSLGRHRSQRRETKKIWQLAPWRAFERGA